MALAITARGTGGNNSAATTVTVTPGSNLAAGSMAVLAIALDNAGSGGASTICAASMVDSVGNTWTRRLDVLYDPQAASAGAEIAFYTADLAVAFGTGNNVVVSFSSTSVTAKAWALWEVTCASLKRVNFVTGAGGSGAGSAAATVTTGSITSGDAIFGATGAESADTFGPDADTTNGSWSTHQHTGFGTGLTGMSITSQGKVVTGTATQTYNTTLTSADWMIGWIQVREVNAYVMAAGAGSFGLSGQATGLLRNRRLDAAASSFGYAGQPTALKWSRGPLAAGLGSYPFTGNAVTLTHGEGGPPATPDIYVQDFEGTGAPSGWYSYFEDYDYTTSPLGGSQSLRLVGGYAGANGVGINHPEVWMKLKLKLLSLPAGYITIIGVSDSGATWQTELLVYADGTWDVRHASDSLVSPPATVPLTTGTTYDVYLHYKKGTGANACFEAWITTTGSGRPHGDGKFASIRSSSAATNMSSFYLNAYPNAGAQAGADIVFDDIELATTDIWGPHPDIYDEGFEGTGDPQNCVGGGADFDDTVLVISGSQSSHHGTSGATTNFIANYPNVLDVTEVWAKFKFRVQSIDPSGHYLITANFYDSAFNQASQGLIIKDDGTITMDFVDYVAFPLSTTLFMWMHVKQSDISEVWWSTTDDRSTAAGYLTWASNNYPISWLQFHTYAAGNEFLLDDLQISTVDLWSGAVGPPPNTLAAGQGSFVLTGKPVALSTTATTYLLNEGFEGTGAPSGFTDDGANYDYTTVALAGAQSLHIPTAKYVTFDTGTNYDEVWFKAMFQITSLPSSGAHVAMVIGANQGGAGSRLTFYIKSDGKATMDQGTYSTMVLAANTTYFLWMHCKRNVIGEAWINTTDNRATAEHLTRTSNDVATGKVHLSNTGAVPVIWDDMKLAQTDFVVGGVAYTLPAGIGAFPYAGVAVGLSKQLKLAAAPTSYGYAGQAVTFALAHKILAGIGAFGFAGTATNFLRSRVMIAAPGAFGYAGVATNFLRSRVMPAALGAYLFTGQAVGFLRSRIMIAAPGAFPYSGKATNFLRSRVMPAALGAYLFTGQAVTFLRPRSMLAAPGAFPFSGKATTFLRPRFMLAAAGAFAYAGVAVAFLKARAVVAAAGSFAFAGQPVTLLRNKLIAAAPGAFPFSGKATNFLRTRVMPAAAGAFAFAGVAANFLRSRVMPAAAGAFPFSGQPVALLRQLKIGLAAGAYAFGGVAVGLFKGRTIVAAAANYLFTGKNVAFALAHKITAAAGAFAFDGKPVTFLRALRLDAVRGTFAFNGVAVALSKQTARLMLALQGMFPFAGNPVTFQRPRIMLAGAGAFGYAGVAVTFLKARTMQATAGAFGYAGVAVNFLRSRVMVASAGSFPFSGAATGLLRALRLATAAGAFGYAGQVVLLFKAKAIQAGAGAFEFVGKAIGFIYHRRLMPATGSYGFSGKQTALFKDRRLTTEVGAYPFSGTVTGLTVQRRLEAFTGLYGLSGKPVTFLITHRLDVPRGTFGFNGVAVNFIYTPLGVFRLVADTGTFAFSGKATMFARTRIMLAAPGSYAFNGQALFGLRGKIFSLAAGAFAYAGQAITFRRTRVMPAARGAFSFSGNPALFPRTRIFVVNAGAFGLTGYDVQFVRRVGLAVLAEAGHFPFIGHDIAISRNMQMVAGGAAFGYAGQMVVLRKGWFLHATPGIYHVTFLSVGLYTGIAYQGPPIIETGAGTSDSLVIAGGASETNVSLGGDDVVNVSAPTGGIIIKI